MSRLRGRMVPVWLHALSSIYLAFGVVSAAIIALDLLRHPQHMWIMNIVWPVTALFGTAWIVWQYFSYGRLASQDNVHAAMQRHAGSAQSHTDALHGDGRQRRFALRQRLHAGRHLLRSGWCSPCRRSPWLSAGTGSFATDLCGLDRGLLFAFAFGIVFQYFTIAPMRGLCFRRGNRRGSQGRHAVAHSLADRHVRLHGRSPISRSFATSLA